MISLGMHRRLVLLVAAGFAAGHVLLPTESNAQATAPKGYVIGPNEGEHLIQRGGSIFIKTDPTKGSNDLAMGTQQVLVGVGIPIHRHVDMDEVFYVVDGAGTFILNDVPHRIQKGEFDLHPEEQLARLSESRPRAAPALDCRAAWAGGIFPRIRGAPRRATGPAVQGANERCRAQARHRIQVIDQRTIHSSRSQLINARSAFGPNAKCRPSSEMSGVGGRPDVKVRRPNRRV